MIKNANEIIEETDEDLQLQAGMQLTSDERQCLLQNGMLLLIFSEFNLIYLQLDYIYKIQPLLSAFGRSLKCRILLIIS